MVLPPHLDIEPEQQALSTEELEAGTAAPPPDRLLQRPQQGSNESTMVLPPLAIAPNQQSLPTEELEAGTESFSPDRLLQRSKEGNTEGVLVLLPPRTVAPEQLYRVKFQPGATLMPSSPPSPPPLRRVVRSCCSSDPKEKQRARQECTGCLAAALRSGCCLFAAGLAILIAYWSLFPMCTTCEDGTLSASSSPSSATEIAAMASSGSGGTAGDIARPFSTLRINQLQVMICASEDVDVGSIVHRLNCSLHLELSVALTRAQRLTGAYVRICVPTSFLPPIHCAAHQRTA